jgi:hypothetical protein
VPLVRRGDGADVSIPLGGDEAGRLAAFLHEGEPPPQERSAHLAIGVVGRYSEAVESKELLNR